MRRSRWILGISGVLAAVACDQSVAPASKGSISVHLIVPAATSAAPAASSPEGAAPAPAATTLESIRVSVSGGPTAKTATFQCTATLCEGTVDGLDPGTYAVTVEGLVGSQVAYYGKTTGVGVTAGVNSSATVTFRSFQPVLANFPADTAEVLHFPVTFSKVAAADSYVVQWDTSATFGNPSKVTLTDTTTDVTVTQEAQYNIRVRAINSVVTAGGIWSAPKAIVAYQGVASVEVTPAGPNIAAGATVQFAAVAKDADNNVVSNVTFFWASSDHNVAVIDQSGLASGVSGGTATITALGKGQPGSATLTVGPQVATKLFFSVQPTTTTAGEAISPAVQVEIRDAANNRVKASRDPVTVALTTPGGATLAGTKTVNAVDGIASLSGLWVNKAATGYTLTASSGSLTGATSSGFNVTPAAPAKLGFSAQPSNVEGNVVISPQVQVTIRDLYDNVVTSATDLVTVSLASNPWKTAFSNGSVLSGTLTNAAAAGVATFNDLRVDKPAPGYALGASSGALVPGTSVPFTVALTIQQVAGGGTHTCAVGNGGSYCWGSNGGGRIGQPLTTSRDSVPALVRGGLTFVKVTAGGGHACGITNAGAAYCWGLNNAGQLGNNSTTSSDVPVLVQGGFQFADIEAGELHTCAITTSNADYTLDRRVLCWGYNYYGQLGDNLAVPGGYEPVPARVDTAVLRAAASIAVGGYHTCARAAGASGVAYCWGRDIDGQVGDGVAFGSVTGRNVPTLVGGGISNWTSLTAGLYHACGTRVSGETLCWGFNYYGQLGNQGNGNSPAYASDSLPRVVYGTLNGTSLSFSSVSAGQYHTCAVTSTGLGYCWGNNGNGQLGDGNQPANTNQPSPVAGGLTFVSTSVTAGYAHSCARTSTAVYCWGANSDGRLGVGATGGSFAVPTQIKQ